ncbi:zinc finger and BTB domain-containing protein 5 [Grus japonensis]|uniref:Zinc finger and BTB domain-containing protein 5 n=1 Tax=Grus japonensis TaxID=30415 RepID=A0ABC9WWH0_GRUJA
MDLLLAKAKPISDNGSTSMITYLRRGKKLRHNSGWKRGVRICERNNSADPQNLRSHGKRSPRWSRFAGRTCDPMVDPRWSSLFLKVCTPWKGPTLEQLVKNCSPWEGLTLEKFVEDCLLWVGPHAGAGEEYEEEGVAETPDR